MEESDDMTEALRDELRDITTPVEDKCAICQATRKRHRQLEEAGELHHVFSVSGELVQNMPQKKPPRTVSTPDLVLRLALVNKGLITGEDLIRAEVQLRDAAIPGGPGHGDRGDRSDRQREASERGLRDPAAEGGAEGS